MIGRVIGGQYRVLERLGAGSTGTVYLARDLRDGHVLALKVLDPEHEGRPLMLARFEREAVALAKINSEHVVQIYAFAHSGTSAYVAMEHVEGRELETILAAHRAKRCLLPLDRVVQIVRAVADALAAAHAVGIAHGDVKPSNVVIENGTGRPVLIDFGLARAWREEPSCPSAGSPAYMAPEQIRGMPDACGAVDTYALACMTFEMLTGEPVFDGEVHHVLAGHLEEAPRLVSDLRADFDVFDDAIRRGLQKTAALRFASPKDFAREVAFAAETYMTRATGKNPKMVSNENLHVLVVAWDPALRHTIVNAATRALEHDDRPLTVECITRGDDVAAALAKMPAAIVVIDDDSMLEGTGLDLVAQIRALPSSGDDAEVILLTTDLAMHAFRARELGAHCLGKPLNLRNFATVIGKGAQPAGNRRRKATTPGV